MVTFQPKVIKKEDAPVGTLAVDSIYTPVKKVNYQVEPARVGSNDGFDKLTIEIMTNGTIIPEDALGLSARVLIEHLNLFTDLTEVAKNTDVMKETEKVNDEKCLTVLSKNLICQSAHITVLNVQVSTLYLI